MSYQVTILILIIVSTALVFGAASLAILWFLRTLVSRCVDQKKIPPSQVTALLLFALGAVVMSSALVLPTALIAMSGVYVLIASITIASAIEKLVIPPRVERRPPWYQGEGDPSWAEWPPAASERTPRRFSMLWLALFVSMLCLSMGGLSIRYRWERGQAARHRQAVARIVQLGGTVQQGDVTLAGTEVEDDDLVCLSDLRDITGLNLGATGITNGGLKHLADLKTIQLLTLSGASIDDQGLSHLRNLPRLSVVLLRQTNVSGVGLDLHKRAPLLTLDVSLCPITREGLVQISRQRCRDLCLAETPIGDEMLAELKGLDVNNLDLTGTKISPAGLAELQAHDPGMRIQMRNRPGNR